MKNTFLIIVGVILAFTLIVLCIVFLGAWTLSAKAERSQLLLELFKGLLQLALILIIGGAIKWFYDEATQERRKDEIEKDKKVQREAEIKALQKEILREFHDSRVSFLFMLDQHRTHSAGARGEYRNSISTLDDLRQKILATEFELDTTPTLFKEYESIRKQLQVLGSTIESVGEEYKSQQEPPDSIQQESLFEQRPKYGHFRMHLDEFGKKLILVETLMSNDIIGSIENS